MNAGNEKAPKRANASRPESKFQGKEISMNERSTAPMQGASAQIIPFKFESHQVRTLLIDGQPWFVASDIASALAYREAETMTRFLDEEEKGPHNVWTLGGIQRMTCINESGLYSAILRSRKAEAKRFKKWVTAEVLPAIRKNGRYEDGAGQMVTLLGQVIGTDGFHVLASIVNGKVRHLPRRLQRGAKNHIWTQVHRAFSVNTVENIPASKFDEARNFVAAYVYEGEVVDKPKRQSLAPDEAVVLDMDYRFEAFSSLMSYLKECSNALQSAGAEMPTPPVGPDMLTDGLIADMFMQRKWIVGFDAGGRVNVTGARKNSVLVESTNPESLKSFVSFLPVDSLKVVLDAAIEGLHRRAGAPAASRSG